jgi:putative membrane protein
MAPRRKFTVLSGTVALVLCVSLNTHAAAARLPWAATSGLHFVDAVVAADNYRAAAGGLAIKKSPSPEVREFGRLLWVGSLENTARLKWVLTQYEPRIVLPTQVSPHYMFVIDQLVFANSDEFDRRFIAQQTASLKEALALAQDYARLGDDFGLKEYAARSVPKIRTQLDRALALQTRHEGSATR